MGWPQPAVQPRGVHIRDHVRDYRSLLHLLVGAKVPRSKSSRVRTFQGAKVPHLELSLPGANGLGSEKSIIRL